MQVAANTRYGVPALLVAAALCAVAAGRLERARWLAELLGLLLVLDGLRRGLHVPGHTVAITIPVLLALACLYGVARLGWRTRLLAPLVAAIAVIAALGVARRLDTHLDHTAWRADPALAWIADHADTGRRIGMGGVWPAGRRRAGPAAFGSRWTTASSISARSSATCCASIRQAARSWPACGASRSDCCCSAAAIRQRGRSRARGHGRTPPACASWCAARASPSGRSRQLLGPARRGEPSATRGSAVRARANSAPRRRPTRPE